MVFCPLSVLKKVLGDAYFRVKVTHFCFHFKERVNLAVNLSEAAAAGFQLFPGPPDNRYSVIEK